MSEKELLEVNDPAIDVDKLNATVQSRVDARRNELGEDGRVFPTYGAVASLDSASEAHMDATLVHHIEYVNKLYAKFELDAVLTESPATRVPVLGKLWGMIRGQAHNLIIFYMNRVVTHQVEVNRHLVNALTLMTREQQRQQRKIAELEEEIKTLRD